MSIIKTEEEALKAANVKMQATIRNLAADILKSRKE